MSDLTWRDRLVAGFVRYGAKPLLTPPTPWGWHRMAFDTMAPRPLRRLRRAVTEEPVQIAGRPCHAIRPTAWRAGDGTLLWVHGGGFVLGSPRAYRNLACHLAHRTGRQVILPPYRLAPDHPFPAGLEDVLAVTRAVAADGAYALGGDSAGGTLSLAALTTLLPEGAGPTHLVLVGPAVDLNPKRSPPPNDEMLLPVPMLRRAVAAYLAGADPMDPRVSPIHGTYAGGPPTLIHCARGEILESDSDAIAARLRAQAVPVTLEKYDGVPHVWHVFAGYTPMANRAVKAIAAFLAAPPSADGSTP